MSNFLPWLDAEFGWSEPTAQRFMRVASNFKSVNLTDLENIAPSGQGASQFRTGVRNW